MYEMLKHVKEKSHLSSQTDDFNLKKKQFKIKMLLSLL